MAPAHQEGNGYFGIPISSTRSPACKQNPKARGADDIINDHELAHRKAQEAGWRRYEATEWLRQMDGGASEALLRSSSEQPPTEEEFCLALRNGLILCNVLNRVNPGAVSKVVESPLPVVQTTDDSEEDDDVTAPAAAQSAIQYFENTRNFIEAVRDMKLLTFQASDLEKGGSSMKVVDCILCLKGYHEWKQAGGIGIWRYGGTVKIMSLQKDDPTALSIGDSASDHDQQLLDLPTEASHEKSKALNNALTFLFDRYGLELLHNFLTNSNATLNHHFNAMLIDTVFKKVVTDFTGFLDSHSNQLGLLLKDILRNYSSVSKAEFIEVVSKYLAQQNHGVLNDYSDFCICGGKQGEIQLNSNHISTQLERLDVQQNQLKVLKTAFQETRANVKHAQSNWEEELRRLEIHIRSLEAASSSYHKLLQENRQLYNQVQDLKGSIRVFCRVRPFLPGQTDRHSTVEYIGQDGTVMIVDPHKQGKNARKVFSFNKVFGANITQEQVFAETQSLIRSVLDGYNVCIFAYGQTGSGKTYTMNGPDLMAKETWGVNYRALNDLFEISKSRLDFIRYEVRVQMIEIYNEQVRDLLVSDGTNKRLDILNISQPNGLNVPDASLVPVKCTQDVLDLMLIGQRNRAVGATALNERSSRSHSVLAVHVHGRELVSGSLLRGCLHLVDLAGSERVDKSEAVGERLKEAQHINRSLSALGDVISSLAQKSRHIPYRNSKLTQVLQDSLGGQAKTLMFVHINPETESVGETISTLKFAERVASIELGAAQANKETGEIRALKDEISNLKLVLGKKEAEIDQLKRGNIQIAADSLKKRAVSPFNIPRIVTDTSLKPETLRSTSNNRSIEISNLKLVLGKKDAEVDQLKRGNIQAAADSQKKRAVSPFNIPRIVTDTSLKPETLRSTSNSRSIEVRSCSSGKQRRPHILSGFTGRDTLSRMPFLGEEDSTIKPRSPSPPVRRSLSTDRGSFRLKTDKQENSPTVKSQFPSRISVNKSVASIPIFPISENNSRNYLGPKNHVKPENVSETLYDPQRANYRKVHTENEDVDFRYALNVRQVIIKKTKCEMKARIKHQFPTRMQRPVVSEAEMGENIGGSKGSLFQRYK